MAADKRKILENARKLAQKGAKAKALKEYQTLVKLDPRDAKLRLEIGDVYRRWGQVDDAIETYTRVADQYMKEGFDARAVAVYKQILNLDPDRHASYEPLAELYERMGLTAEAISALQTAADGYHRDGKKREALELLRRMATIDPSNTTSRIKVAELLRQEDMLPEAMTEYDEIAQELTRQGDVEAAGNVYQRVLEIDSNRVVTLERFAQNLLQRGKGAEAESLAKRALSLEEDEPRHYELLADIYRAQEREDALPEVYRPLAELYRRRGDDEKARDILQRFVPSDGISADSDADLDDPRAFIDDSADSGAELGEQFAAPLDELSPPGGDPFANRVLDDGGLPELELDSEVGTTETPEPSTNVDDLLELSSPILETDSAPEPPAPASEPPPAQDTGSGEMVAGDPDQLLAEASVYLRYGKRDKAVSHLEAILRIDPEHRLALEKLGEAFAEGGEDERAVENWLAAAKCAQEQGDEAAVAALRGRIEVLDAAAAATLAPPPEPEPVVEPPTPEPAAEAEAEASSDDLDLDLDLDLDDDLDDDDGGELDLDLEPDGAPADSVPEEQPEPAISVSSQSLSTTTAQQIVEDLEEADFYMDQGLHAEAEEIFQRVLALAPNHPKALLRLGEVAAARGEDPGSTGTLGTTPVAHDEAPENEAAPAAVDSLFEDSEPAEAAADDVVLEEPSLEPDVASEPEPLDPDASTDDIDLDLGAELAPEREAPDPVDEEIVAEEDTDEEVPLDDETGEFSTESLAVAVEKPAEPSPRPVRPGEGFDLAAELSDVFEDDPNEASSADRSTDDGFAAVFDAFKKGVNETLSEADHEAHYDLGIAYKEMGLLDDAIQEFRAAMVHPPRVVECLHLIGLCALDAGKGELAVEHLEQLLETDGISDGQALASRYELGRAYEMLSRVGAARTAFAAVVAAEPDFLDAAERLANLGEPEPEPPADESEASGDEGFESFEDVIAEAKADDEAPVESFDDLVSEANAELEEEADELDETGVDRADPDASAESLQLDVGEAAPGMPEASEAEATPESETATSEVLEVEEAVVTEPEPEPEPKKKRRKKKISFL